MRLLLLTAVVLVSRAPFLDAGYGTDPDAWRVAFAARTIRTTGQYMASRLPGYPIQELTYALLWPAEPWAFNAVTALFSAIAAAFFALSLHRLGCKDRELASLALVFTPVVFINSTNAMDYVWALAFLMGSFYAVLACKPLIAGILLGLAIGCRITSGVMLLPFSLFLLVRENSVGRLTRLAIFVAPACAVGIISFVPVFAAYGTDFWTFYESTYPPLRVLVTVGTERVWGQIGAIVLVCALSTLAFRHRAQRRDRSSTRLAPSYILACIIAVALPTLIFLRLPLEAGYLIPALPFAMLLLATGLERRVFQLLCIALLITSFIGFNRSGVTTGLLFADRTGRVANARVTTRALGIGARLREKSLIVAGPLLPQIQTLSVDNPPRNVTYVYALDVAQIQAYRSKGYFIYYLIGMREFNLQQFDVDLEQYGATLLGPRGRGTVVEDVDAE